MSNKAFQSNNENFFGYEPEIQYLDFFLKKKATDPNENPDPSQPQPSHNFPLIITGDEGCGKTSLVVTWLSHHLKTTKNPHLLVYHFAGVSNCDLKYQSFIFRTLVKLRQEYDIQHRVEIIDDKLRMNFSRWLEIASQKHEERLDPQAKIVIILDGLENFIDVDNGGEESADWIPWTFPEQIKVVMMTRKNSKAMNHFRLRKYPILYMDQFQERQAYQMIEEYLTGELAAKVPLRLITKIKEELLEKRPQTQTEAEIETNEMQGNYLERFQDQEDSPTKNQSLVSHNSQLGNTAMKYLMRKTILKNITQDADSCEQLTQPLDPWNNPLILKALLNFCLLYNKYEEDEDLYKVVPMEINMLLAQPSLRELFKASITHFRQWIFGTHADEQAKFDQLLSYIFVSRKGISEQELQELIPNLSEAQMKRFLSIFGFILVQEKEQIFIKHSSFKKAIKESVQLIANEDQKVLLHRNLSNVIEKEAFSLRQVDELSHQYYMGKCWIKLKDLISNIEVFSIMFVPEIKHELASYWQCLEQHKYDPVAEYNKALEGFVVKYRPNNQELFVILIQLSRFFKELADLETKYTPQFKHPPLRGQSELESITLLGELQKLDDLYNPNTNVTVANEPLLGDVEHFNVDNTIVREQIMAKIKKELEDQRAEKNKETLQSKEERAIYYYYKRWIWVQFPWCTIDVYSNLSNIMEMSMGSHTNYISTAKENELVNGTIQILKEAKLRKKNRLPGANGGTNQTVNNSTMEKSRGSKSLSPTRGGLKKSTSQTRMSKKSQQQQQMNSSTLKPSALPPIAPGKGGNKNQNSILYHSMSLQGPRSNSQGRRMPQEKTSLLSLALDTEDKKSPEKMLMKLTDKINELERNELLNFEHQNIELGSDLNQITFQILRKEKELRYLEELFEGLQSEESLNQQEKVKLETTEAKLLRAYENLNRVEVEKKRLEQIFTVCQRNPAKNQEWIRNLESQVDSMRKLVRYQEQQITEHKNDEEDYYKGMNDLVSQMEEKKRLRDQAIMKVSKIIDKKRSLDQKVQEVEEQRQQILKGMEGPEKTINKLKQRQIVYRKWLAKLLVTKAFVNEKRNFYEKAFRKVTAVTGISNPNDIEGLLGFIERTNDLRKTKQVKEKKIDKLKQEKLLLEDDLRAFMNNQPQYDHTQYEFVLTKTQEKEKRLRELKVNQQKMLQQMADVKSGIVNIAKKLKMPQMELYDENLNQYLEQIVDRLDKSEKPQVMEAIKEEGSNLEGKETSSVLKPSALNEDLNGGQSLQLEENKQSSINVGAEQSTPLRNKRNRQPKQRGSHQMEGESAMNSFQQMFHHSVEKIDVDSETEERDQIKRDRFKAKNIVVPTSAGIVLNAKEKSRNHQSERQSSSMSGVERTKAAANNSVIQMMGQQQNASMMQKREKNNQSAIKIPLAAKKPVKVVKLDKKLQQQ